MIELKKPELKEPKIRRWVLVLHKQAESRLEFKKNSDTFNYFFFTINAFWNELMKNK